MSSPEEMIDEILEMTKAQRVELFNEEQLKLTVLKEHLNDAEYVTDTGLFPTQEQIVNILIRKGYCHGSWVFTAEQIARFIDVLDDATIRGDLKSLVAGGWLKANHKGQFTLSQEVLSGKLRYASTSL